MSDNSNFRKEKRVYSAPQFRRKPITVGGHRVGQEAVGTLYPQSQRDKALDSRHISSTVTEAGHEAVGTFCSQSQRQGTRQQAHFVLSQAAGDENRCSPHFLFSPQSRT